MTFLFFLLIILIWALIGYLLFRRTKLHPESHAELYGVFDGHPIKTPSIEIQKITWLVNFTVTFYSKADFEYAKNNGLLNALNLRIKKQYFDVEFPVERKVRYRWTN